MYSELQVGVAESKDPNKSRSNSQLNRLLVGSDFKMGDGAFQLIPDFNLSIPLMKNSSDAVQTGEDTFTSTAQIIGLLHWSKFLSEAHGGVTYRGDGLSTLFIYGVGSQWIFSSKNTLGAEIRGLSSITDDKYSNQSSQRESIPLSVNGRSAKLNTVNPTLLESNIWIQLTGQSWGTQLGIGTTINGSNTAAGQQAFMNLIYNFNLKSAQSEPVQFIENTEDGIDQNLFKPTEVKPPPPPPVKKSPDIQKELDKTEMQIKLKSKKKKK